MSLDHTHAPMTPRLRLRLWWLKRLEMLLLPRRRNSDFATALLKWVDTEYARIHHDLHRDGGDQR
ncbi:MULTISPECIES: hypothetical protein [unclassified Sphingomonas]|uniref:hypothetical protein n=1 Tax=unclassified Sphingomonas TaxID=196159 RepID=UPI000928E9B9|nr:MULTISPECIES: hypothetical protein [unclassified Sphingomonas]OJU21712.1 MAG: hypothetical protein BGN95_03665 [Sphingomonas sp. 66-10]